MRLILNMIWLITGGLWLALGYLLAGIVACIFIVTIPIGVASFRMASYALWPFGRTVVAEIGGTKPITSVANAMWFVIAGLWLALGHVTTALAQFVTIIGIPLAIANVKMIPVTCFPFGKQIVDSNHIPFGYAPMLKI
ncbi:YccF domain-containing protein [Corynebacterium kutscheri]|uniref:YccF domain-containing protein n=1 Tax=Corynebacterium kutscheri TaxID=35755 RepID=UPI0037C10FF3